MFLPIVDVLSPCVDPEDDIPSSFGPPPDPSLRSWRHPSELAAEQLAAGQANTTGPSPLQQPASTSPTQPGRRVWSATIAATLIIGVGLGTAAAFFGGSRVDVDIRSTEDTTQGLHSTTRAGQQAPGIDTATTLPNPAGVSHPRTVATFSDVIASTSQAPTTRPVDAVSRVNLDRSAQGVLQLFASPNQMPVANGIVIDGLILTSASSLGGFEQVFALTDGRWIGLSLVASDPQTDVAVLQQSGPGAPLTPVVTAVGGPVADAGQVVAILDGEIGATSADNTRSVSARSGSVGEVVATGGRTTTKNGYEILGAVLTTCRKEGVSAGAALIDEDGLALGIILNSNDKLASALPLDTALEIGWSLIEEGWRGGAWLGVSGQTVDEGFLLFNIDPSGPSARAGLRNGDIIISINEQPLDDWAELLHTLRLLDSGDILSLRLLRTNEENQSVETVTIDIELGTKETSDH